MTKHLILSILLILTTIAVQAQQESAAELLAKANSYYEANEYEEAIALFRDVLLLDNSQEAKEKLAKSYRITKRYDQAEYWYRLTWERMQNTPENRLHFGQILQSNGKYKEAKKQFLEYAKFDPLGKKLAEGIDKIDVLKQNKSAYKVSLLPINSPDSDICALSNYNEILFCSNRKEESDFVFAAGKSAAFDIFTADMSNGTQLGEIQRIKGKINSPYNDGPLTLFEGGNKMLFTRNAYFKGRKILNSSGRTMVLQLFEAQRFEDGRWGEVKPFMHNSTDYSVAHPTISKDGQTLIFASDMPGGSGGMDLYICSKIDSVNWTAPVSLGKQINSAGNEVFPFFHEDGSLYFASDGHPGLGGLDIYVTRRVKGKWKVPKNMAIPINSSMDDFALVFNNDKGIGYFSSNREGGMGKDDIYYVNLEVESDRKVPSAVTTTINKKWTDQGGKEVVLNDRMGLNKVYFTPGGTDILPEAAQELDKVALFMQINPSVGLALNAHTDSRADDYISLEISKKRAEAAKDYIISKGIDANRLVASGFGEAQLLNHCKNGISCTEELHSVNNRIMVSLLGGESVNMDQLIFKNDLPPEFANDQTKTSEKKKKTKTKILEPVKQEDTWLEQTEDPDFLENADFSYIVYLGPYKTVDNNTFYAFAELNTPIEKEPSSKGVYIALGPYKTIAEAEKYEVYAKERGAKKTSIMVLNNGIQTEIPIRKLKKMGIQ